MSRSAEFSEAKEGDHIVLYHGTEGDPESIREKGLVRNYLNKPDPTGQDPEGMPLWATQRPIHTPAGWPGGWGKTKFKTPHFPHVVEFRVPRSDVEEDEGSAQNYKVRRSVRPDEIVAVHDMEALHGPHIARAKKLHAAEWKRRMGE